MGRLAVTEQLDQKHQEDLQRLRGFRLLDVRTQVFVENLLNRSVKLTLEKIAEYAGLPLDEVKKLKAERTLKSFTA